MTEQIVNYDTATLAKKVRFNINCKLFYVEKYKDRYPMQFNITAEESLNTNTQYSRYILAPRQTLLQKWLRDEHRIFVEINTDCTTYPKFCFNIKQFIGNPKNLSEKEWGWSFPVHNERWELERTYEEALEVGLQEALKLIK